jgi:diguanylate cyclase (GGDEF)-like protein
MRGVTNRTVEQLAAFNELAKALTSTLELREVLQLVMQKVETLLKPRNWSLLLEDKHTGKLYFELVIGPGTETLRDLRLDPTEGIAGAVFQSGEPLRVDDVRKDPRFAKRFDQVSDFETRSVVAVPLKSRGQSRGVIELVNGPDDPLFTDDDLQMMVGISDFAAIAIENARNFQRVQELTLTDEHTGLYNARHLHALLDQEIVRSARFGHPLALVFLDLDRFKLVNDTHGHLIGSRLLRGVGELLHAEIRQVDSAFRYGGDEFALLLIETDAKGAALTAERILQRLSEKTFFEDSASPVKISASFGVAAFPDHAKTATALLNAADRAMYDVKQHGRGAVRAASRGET